MLFGPLAEKNCIFFLILSMCGIFLVILLLIILLFNPMNRVMIYMIIMGGMIYFQNRLLYNMCTNKILEGAMDFTDSIAKSATLFNQAQSIDNAWQPQYKDISNNFIPMINNYLNQIQINTTPKTIIAKPIVPINNTFE